MPSKRLGIRLFFIILFCFCFLINAQSSDSLNIKNYSSEKLYEILNKGNLAPNQHKAYAEYFYKKVMDSAPNDNTYKAYIFLTEAYIKNRLFDKALNSIKESFKYSSSDNEKVLSLIHEGTINVNTQEYDKALNNYFEALRLSKKNGFIQHEIRVSINIANIRARLWQPETALKSYKENLKLLHQPKVLADTLFFRKADLILNYLIASTYNDLEPCKPDSALYLIRKVLKKSNDYQLTSSKNSYLITVGRSHHFLKQCDSALWYYDKVLKAYQAQGKDRNLDNLNFKIGRCLFDTKKYKESIESLKKIDTIAIQMKKNDVVFLNLICDAFDYISKAYKEEDSIVISNYYAQRFKHYDRIHDKQRFKLTNRVHEEFDKQLLEDKLAKTHHSAISFKYKYWFMIVVSFILFSGIIFGFMYISKQKKRNKTAYETLLKKVALIELQKNEDVKSSTTKSTSIPSEKVTRILAKLSKLEKENSFLLRQDCSLRTLAKKLGTNTMYLSKIINTHKGTNFSSYLTDIRLKHGILRLKNDPIFRNYSIKSIAEELGFKSDQSFSRAFKKHTGIYPSYYIKNLKSQK